MQDILGLDQTSQVLEIKHLIDVPHFVKKSGAPMLQLADACAFSFSRYLSKQSDGRELCLAMLGPQHGEQFVTDPAWFSGGSFGLFNTDKYWSAEQQQNFQLGNVLIDALRSSSEHSS